MKLERDHNCVRNMNWRSDVEPAQVDPLIVSLTKGGRYRKLNSMPFLVTLEGPDQTRVLLVPRTGRVQIRVSYEVAEEERRFKAEAVYADIVRANLLPPK
jgi:hypothetical protein